MRRPALALAALLLAACASSRPAVTPAPTPDATAAEDALGRQIVGSAREAMGRPYRLGGRGDDGTGFDCSGLIQYAYQQHGIALPRVSVDQAQAGVGIPREVEQLMPGDLLTFAREPGGTAVAHVGMYVGDGRFIHSSSSRGVTESALTADDPEGRWWVKRWVGVRRILGY